MNFTKLNRFLSFWESNASRNKTAFGTTITSNSVNDILEGVGCMGYCFQEFDNEIHELVQIQSSADISHSWIIITSVCPPVLSDNNNYVTGS